MKARDVFTDHRVPAERAGVIPGALDVRGIGKNSRWGDECDPRPWFERPYSAKEVGFHAIANTAMTNGVRIAVFVLISPGAHVADLNESGRIRDPLEDGEDKGNSTETSRSREESMNETGKDAFGDKSAARNPDATAQGDGTSEPADNTYIGRVGEQFSSTSGTTSLGGEPRDADSKTGPGGVEGERDNR